jgi:O-antigen/teichoic acid export membrane protein
MTDTARKIAFFRQSGWMVIATTAGGGFMWLVHVPAAARMPLHEYGVFLALLQILGLMMIPALGLQTIFAQQTAAAIDEPRRQQLASAVRWLLLGTFLIWLAMSLLAVGFRVPILAVLKIKNPAALWITVAIGLVMLWLPIGQGVLQGLQNFLWLGWVQVLNGAGRFAGVVVIVYILGAYAAGAMTAALLGFCLAGCLVAWQSRAVLVAPGAPNEWRAWLGRAVPLSLGLGACQFAMSVDQIVVQSIFDKNVTGLYGAAGMIGRALVYFTVPVLSVMFPKVVESAARSEKTGVLAQALGATALLGGLAALACTLLPELPLRIIYKREYWGIAPLVPWFAWCMLPLTLANVLIGNLLARERFDSVPWLVVVAAAYGAALMMRAEVFQQAPQFQAFKMVVQTIGVFSFLLLSVAAWFTWGRPAPKATSPNTQAAP